MSTNGDDENFSFQWVNGQCKWFAKKVTSIEKRGMDLNFLGHEVVRMIISIMMSYLPSGDPKWLLRSVRTTGTKQRKNTINKKDNNKNNLEKEEKDLTKK